MPSARVFRLLRDAAVSTAVAAGVFALFEVGLRVAAPQLPRTEVLHGETRALPDSVLGYRLRPSSRAVTRTPEFTVEYVVDSHGRRARSVPAPADSSAVRVLVLGDSFTFGDGNAEDDVWIRVAERALRARGHAVDFVNAGVEGYDTRSELLYLRELAPELYPDVVLLAFVANDVYTNTPLDAPPPNPPVARRGGLPLHTVAWAKRLAMRNDRVYARLFLLSARRQYYAVPPGPRVAGQIELTRALVAGMEAFCRERGIAFAVVSIPQQFAVLAQGRRFHFQGVDPSVIDAALEPLARERNFPWVETLPALVAAYRAKDADLFYRVDGHLTAAGNRVVGEAVAETLAPLASYRAHPPR